MVQLEEQSIRLHKEMEDRLELEVVHRREEAVEEHRTADSHSRRQIRKGRP